MCDTPKPAKKQLHILLDQELYDELQLLAIQSNRTVPRYIRQALKLHLSIASWFRH